MQSIVANIIIARSIGEENYLLPVSQFVRSVNTYYWIRLRLTPAGEGDGYEIVMTVNTELDHQLQLNLLPGK